MYRSPILMQSFVKILLDLLKEQKSNIRIEEKAIEPEKLLKMIQVKLGIRDLNRFKIFVEDINDFSVSIYKEKLANGEISRDFLRSFAEFWLKWLKTYTLDNYFFCYNIKENKGKRFISLEIVALDPREVTIPILNLCWV